MDINLNEISITEISQLNHPLTEAIKELKSASDAIQKMADIGVGNFHIYDRSWRDFLHSIDRFWNKVISTCNKEKKWQTLNSKYSQLRKKDPLLNYLMQARNASEHTISPVIKEWDANLRAEPTPSGINLKWNPWDRPLLPINNRGTVFQPPKKHLGKTLQHYREKRIGVEEPRVAAELSMIFYLNAFNEIDQALFKNKME